VIKKTFFAALFIASLSSASGAPFQLTFTGGLTAADALNPAAGPITNVTDGLPFTFKAIFDDTSPNLAPSFFYPHFVAYSPISASLEIAGQTYRVTTAAEDPTNGVAVAIFDDQTFFVPDRFAVGFIQDVPADGAGIVGDWSSASPAYTADNLVPTTLMEFNGTGFRPGPPQTPGDIFGPTLVRPIPLWIGSDPYHLTLHLGQHEYSDGASLNTAVITAIPEPATFGFAAAAVVLLLARRCKSS
jgi:hypothetical protein